MGYPTIKELKEFLSSFKETDQVYGYEGEYGSTIVVAHGAPYNTSTFDTNFKEE